MAALPTAPPRETTGHLLLRAWCVFFVILLALGGVGLVNAAGPIVAAVVAVVSAVVSAVIWIVTRPPPLAVRRTPLAGVRLRRVGHGLALVERVAPGIRPHPAAPGHHHLPGLFVGAVLTWRDVVRAVASAASGSWVCRCCSRWRSSVLVRGPLLPGSWSPRSAWTRSSTGRATTSSTAVASKASWATPTCSPRVMLVAVIVFGVRLAAGAPRRALLIVWIVVAGFLFVRAGSATAFIAAAFVLLVLGTSCHAHRPPPRRTHPVVPALRGDRRRRAGSALWLGREAVFGVLGRGRRPRRPRGRLGRRAPACERAPLRRWGFSTPWIPTEPLIDGWIVEHGQTVVQAHSIWLDAFLQLGAVGVVLLALVYLAYLWRSWFFAVDRPRWDLRDDRPYSPLTLLPTLIGALLVVQGLTESGPLLLWGWMFVVLFGAKIKQTPLVGHGPSEQSIAIERGELPRPTV